MFIMQAANSSKSALSALVFYVIRLLGCLKCTVLDAFKTITEENLVLLLYNYATSWAGEGHVQ